MLVDLFMYDFVL